MRWRSKLTGVLAGGLLLVSCTSGVFEAGDLSAFVVQEDGRQYLAVWASPSGVGEGMQVEAEVVSPSGLSWTFRAEPVTAGDILWYGSSSLQLPLAEKGTYLLSLTRSDGEKIEQEFQLPSGAANERIGPFSVAGRVISWNDGKSLSWVAYDASDTIVGSGVATGNVTAPASARRIAFAWYAEGKALVESVELD
ncbi:MAG: hypothetical protein SPF89_07195 [Sphaerochaetaceae bacterium]|nr:hypothetical protein [Spirochaetales bacterium]MDY5499872.1 hypothetical protein [Sphaerochaetaceae bacterium]